LCIGDHLDDARQHRLTADVFGLAAASVCGSAAGRFTSASIRDVLLSAFRSTFPARRPQTEAKTGIKFGTGS